MILLRSEYLRNWDERPKNYYFKGWLKSLLLMKLLFVLACQISISGVIEAQSDMNLDPFLLTERIKKMINDAANVIDIQKYVLEKLKFKDELVSNSAATDLEKMADIIGKRIEDRVLAVRRLRDAVLKAYSGKKTIAESCCEVENLSQDPRFKETQMVSVEKVCEHVSPYASTNATKLTKDFQDVSTENLHHVPSLKWQYFGSREGVVTMFPATRVCDETYDHRLKSWYVQAHISGSAHVLIVIDASRSMRAVQNGKTLLTFAKQAARKVLEGLSPYNKFAVVSFSNRPETWRSVYGNGNCYSNEMAHATPLNKARIAEYIDSLEPYGGSYYVIALEKAIHYLSGHFASHQEIQSNEERTLGSIVHFISDGYSDDSREKVMQTLQFESSKLRHQFILMTYGVGNGNFDLLKEMAESEFDAKQSGNFIRLLDEDEIRKQTDSIFDRLSKGIIKIDEPVFSVPYKDTAGLGQVISVSLPVYMNELFIGVVAVDAPLDDLLAEAINFRPNSLSYAFIMTKSGVLINHPLFPQLEEDQSIYIKATAVERDQEFLEVYESMKKGESGRKTFIAVRYVSQGRSRWYGTAERKVLSTYYWKPVPNTPFRVCLVIATSSARSMLLPHGSLPPGSFLHHRLNLHSSTDLCSHVNKLSSRGKSSVFLTPLAFNNTENYFYTNFTQKDLQDMIQYLEGTGPNKSNLKEDVKPTIVATHVAEDLWKKKSDENYILYQQVIWRYIGTNNGVFRIYPGTQMPTDFDHRNRIWYQRAYSHSEKIIVAPPSTEINSGYRVLTFSTAITQSRKKNSDNTTSDENVFAVVGTDILLNYFNQIVMDAFPVCKEDTKFRCVIIDDAGFLILHDKYLSATFSDKTRHAEHLANAEPQIAHVLIQHRILKRINCSNLQTGQLQRTYTVDKNQAVFLGTFGRGLLNFLGFKFIPVPETNLYVIIMSVTDSSCVNVFFCHCVTPDADGGHSHGPITLEVPGLIEDDEDDEWLIEQISNMNKTHNEDNTMAGDHGEHSSGDFQAENAHMNYHNESIVIGHENGEAMGHGVTLPGMIHEAENGDMVHHTSHENMSNHENTTGMNENEEVMSHHANGTDMSQHMHEVNETSHANMSETDMGDMNNEDKSSSSRISRLNSRMFKNNAQTSNQTESEVGSPTGSTTGYKFVLNVVIIKPTEIVMSHVNASSNMSAGDMSEMGHGGEHGNDTDDHSTMGGSEHTDNGQGEIHHTNMSKSGENHIGMHANETGGELGGSQENEIEGSGNGMNHGNDMHGGHENATEAQHGDEMESGHGMDHGSEMESGHGMDHGSDMHGGHEIDHGNDMHGGHGMDHGSDMHGGHGMDHGSGMEGGHSIINVGEHAGGHGLEHGSEMHEGHDMDGHGEHGVGLSKKFEYGLESCTTSWNDAYCECPCTAVNPLFIPCLNEYDELYRKYSPPCVPDIGNDEPLEQPEDDLASLSTCYNISFDAFLEKEESSSVGMIVGLTVGSVGLLIGGVLIKTFYLTRKSKLLSKQEFLRRKSIAMTTSSRTTESSNKESQSTMSAKASVVVYV